MRRTRRQRATQAVANTQFTGLVGTGVGGDREGAHTCLPIQLPTCLQPAYTPTARPCLHTYGTPLPTHPRDAPANTPTARPCLARPCLHTYGTTLQQRPIVFRL